MFNHTSSEYVCPICLAIAGIENDTTWIKQQDIVYRDDLVAVFIGTKFIKGNEGYPLVVPVKHFENVYDLPPEYANRVMEVATKAAVALKNVRKCDGVTLIQNNEPAGDQHAFHYHLHVIPRFEGDHFHEELFQGHKSEPADRIEYAENLRAALMNS